MKKVVSNLLINKRLQILLLLRDNKPGIMYPGLWGFIGGEVEKGETAHVAAIREIKEETGLQLHVNDLHPFMTIQTPNKNLNIFWLEGDWRKKDLVRGEGQELRFVNMKEIKKLPMSPYHRYVVYILKNYLTKMKMPPDKPVAL